ncbi:metal ABC transporter ATP-binding protein [bacterium]|nr:metal ABC transporter ATP-binding protein [bacterium]UNM09275.1 MAG: metal ABC transporter ATP-binding protein [Planctomycetales bacterium]
MLNVDSLTVRYGKLTALDSVSFALAGGEFLAVVGPNGSGKSSLLKCLLGLAPFQSGSISLLGHAPDELPSEKIGYVPQVKTLDLSFPASSCELVASGLRRRWPWKIGKQEHERAEAALRQVGIGHLSHRSLAALSGGELQRVYLARALARQPQLLVLDEPATGIDATAEQDMYDILERVNREQGVTIIMVTHDWLAARHHCSHALLLKSRMISFGTSPGALSDENMATAFGHSGHRHSPEGHSHG